MLKSVIFLQSGHLTMPSTNPIPRRERLIVALDVPDAKSAREFVTQLGDSVAFYKIGLELFMAGGYFELLEWLANKTSGCSWISSSSTSPPRWARR